MEKKFHSDRTLKQEKQLISKIYFENKHWEAELKKKKKTTVGLKGR